MFEKEFFKDEGFLDAEFSVNKNTQNIDVTVISPLGYTGLAYYDYSLCESLSALGLNVELFTSDSWILKHYNSKFKIIEAFSKCSGKRSRLVKGVNYLFSIIKIMFYLCSFKRKVVHFQILEFPLLDLMLFFWCALLSKKIVFTPHDIAYNKRYFFTAQIFNIIYRLADVVIVHKEVNADQLSEKYSVHRRKIKICPHGNYNYFVSDDISREAARQKLSFPLEKKIVLFFGNIKPGKGLEVLLPAIKDVKAKRNDMLFVIAGRVCGGYGSGWLDEQLVHYNIQDITLLHDYFIPDEDVEYYYHSADVVVLPYTEISESGVVKYAQTCGRFVLCSDLPEFGDTVFDRETGWLFKTGNSDELSEVLADVSNDKYFDDIGSNGRIIMNDKYSWSDVAKSTAAVYKI